SPSAEPTMRFRSACSTVVLASLLAVPPLARAALPDISSEIKSLASADEAQRVQAAEAIAKHATGPDAQQVAAVLVKAIGNTDSQTRYQIVRVLADFGKSAQGAAPSLVALLKNDKDELVRAAAARSLGYIVEPNGPELASLADAIV